MTVFSTLIEQKLHALGTLLCQSLPEIDAHQLNQHIQQYAFDENHPIGQLGYAVAMSDFVENVLQKQPHLPSQGERLKP